MTTSCCGPGRSPSVQRVHARPCASVSDDVGEIAPVVVNHAIRAPAIGLAICVASSVDVNSTTTESLSATPGGPDCPSPNTSRILKTVKRAVALKVTLLPKSRSPWAAVSVWLVVLDTTVQPVDARPVASDVVAEGLASGEPAFPHNTDLFATGTLSPVLGSVMTRTTSG